MNVILFQRYCIQKANRFYYKCELGINDYFNIGYGKYKEVKVEQNKLQIGIKY